ncbi:ABC-type nitrate/sulfonate/bicarbonate transport system permease component [Prauserella shujinwangii]|uniref:ABC-type nitrate/sulfonate/bicarbonate transport system permease component n=1 Tax=Prauserella shujinwangii TaxID=1453103 RepID=A0A2T0LSJ1_9PSEU|nr:ABC transporter permease [Prauserella shujinwangii]PRX46614.1 ABC-type nitrate/sulfonate/bicarbonate transport system permease component [Prauserella shujinwangii]
MRHLRLVAQGLALPLLLVGAWWWVSADSTSPYFPPLREIVAEFADTWLFTGIRDVLLPTLGTFLAGYSIAIVAGVVLGVALAANDAVAGFLAPLLEFLRALPPIALVPAFISVLGLGEEMRISAVVFASIWPVLLNTIDGVRGVDVVIRDSVTVFRVPRAQRLLFVTLPGASPQIVAGVRVGLALSLIAVIVTEMVTSADGVGAFSRSAQLSFDLPAMWTAIILMGFVGYTLNLLFDRLEKRTLRWHLRMREPAS